MQTNIDLDALTGILQDEMKNRGITGEVKKMIAVLQNIKGQKVWNVNCILSGMDLLRAHVEDESRTVLKMEKSSMMDYIRKIPGLPQQSSQPQVQVQQPQTQEDTSKKLEQLDKLQKAIEKEKAEMLKQQKQKSKPKKKSK